MPCALGTEAWTGDERARGDSSPLCQDRQGQGPGWHLELDILFIKRRGPVVVSRGQQAPSSRARGLWSLGPVEAGGRFPNTEALLRAGRERTMAPPTLYVSAVIKHQS